MTTNLTINPETQPKLVTVARGLTLKALQSAEVVGALNAAASLEGMLVTDEASEASATDLVGTIVRGKRALKAAADSVLELPKAMVAAVRDVVSPQTAKLEAGEKAGKDAVARYLAEKRKAAQEAERQRAEDERLLQVAHELRVAEAAPDEDVPPPMTEAPAPAFKAQARAGTTMLHEIKVLHATVVDLREVDPEWLELKQKPAQDAFREAVRRGNATEPGDESAPVLWCGLQFWFERRMATRGDFRR